MSIYDEIAKSAGVEKHSLFAKDMLTLKAGGRLENVFTPKNVAEFLRVLDAFEQAGIQPFLLGGGSNVVAMDGQVKTPVVLTTSLDKIRIENGFAFAECGARISVVLRRAREHNLGGFEFLAGVPLTVGGACKMNASAFGRQIFDFIESIFVFSRACDECAGAHNPMRVQEVQKSDVCFGYRKGVGQIVVGAKFRLERIEKSKSVERAQECLKERRKRQPIGLSVGSVFKNGELPAGKMIEDCELKGLKVGGAKISEKHANFIINEGTATADDFLTLVEICEREVERKYNVKLEREFVLLK